MNYDYMFVLRQAHTQALKQFSLLLCVLSILAFIFFQLRISRIDAFQSFSILMVIVTMLIDYRPRNRKSPPEGISPINIRPVDTYTGNSQPGTLFSKANPLPFSLSLLVAGICWIGMPMLNWLCLAFFLMSLLEYQARQPVQIILGADIIIVQGFLKRKYPWYQLSNVVLKDGLLTLDFKSNRIIQKEITGSNTGSNYEDEDLFNRYCQLKMSGASG